MHSKLALLLGIMLALAGCGDDGGAPSCGNGVVDPGETCDGDCANVCTDGVACTADGASCNSGCDYEPIISCVNGDGCCADGCSVANDDDCSASCGNGLVETNETCDGNCPGTCTDGNACTIETLVGSAASCSAACSSQPITVCNDGDGCCAAGCTVATDNDCSASCGDGVVTSGETCDGNCPTGCTDGNACTIDTLAGAASSCSAACSYQVITQCFGGDGCCAPGCNANNDSDCSPTCGNTTIENGETCDGNCPTSCSDGVGCTIDTLNGSATNCSAACGHQPITQCTSNDGCCAPGCTANDDNDCSPSCGNNFVEPGETCDGNCPTSCSDGSACTIDALVGSSGTCSAACVYQTITQCTSGDGCCAAGCNANNDSDCSPSCGNGEVEGGETCDGNCPASCSDGAACTIDTLVGSAASCSAACSHQAISQCVNGDGCCAPGCTAVNDNNCSATCGNNVVEPGETCDGNCPASCGDDNTCTIDVLSGSAASCSAVCAPQAITQCAGGDGCCPPGCTAATDGDCTPGTPKIALGQDFTCALLASGAVRCWGNGFWGQLGYGNTNDIGDNETPASAGDVMLGGTAVMIAAGDSHACAIMTGGAVRCWGYGAFGMLGYGNQNQIGDNETPASAGDVMLGGTAIAIAAGGSHTCAILTGGAVRCWGWGGYGQLGYGNLNSIGDNETPASAGDVQLGGTAIAISVASSHSCAVLTGGAVRCWGHSPFGELGYGNTNDIGDNETPASAGDVPIGGTAIAIAVGGTGIMGWGGHSCAVLTTGAVRCWGWGGAGGGPGELGYNNTTSIGDNETPASAGDVPVGGNAVAITAGWGHTCARLGNGKVRCWGGGGSGLLGYGSNQPVGDTLSRSILLAGNVSLGGAATSVVAGDDHTCATLIGGAIRCWGNGLDGRLGYSNTINIGDNELPVSVGPVIVE